MRTWLAVANLFASLSLGAWFFPVVLVGLILSATLFWVVGLGVLFFAVTLRLAARMAITDRNRIAQVTGVRITPLALRAPASGLTARQRRRSWATDVPVRRLAAFQLLRPPLVAAAIFAVVAWTWLIIDCFLWAAGARSALVLAWNVRFSDLGAIGTLLVVVVGLAGVMLWPSVVRAGSDLEVATAHRLLGPSPTGELSLELRRLSEARELALDMAEHERRRIERDLHDGFQPRLVALSIQLGLAKARAERDPAATKALLEQAHKDVKSALEDLRGLVRGIHPSVLDERGLDAALSSLVAGSPIPFRVEVELAHRPDHTREGVAYFVTAEAINNVTKHSGARSASVTITDAGGMLKVVVEDNGHGGAHLAPSGGLAGLRDRLAAVDGELVVTSPDGGPTRIEAVIPCAS